MENAILATLAYADAADMPLTAMQVFERLILPDRADVAGDLTLGSVVQALDMLVAQGRIRQADGWYLMHGTPEEAVAVRLSQANVNADKWRRMLRKARGLQAVPFVQAIAASGSLAVGTTGPRSDWDMFVIAKQGRLYTARIFLLLAARFMGVLRTKRVRVAPDKFCFNHYVTDGGFALTHRSLYVANALAGLIPIFDRGSHFGQFRKVNGWTGAYLAHGLRPRTMRYRSADETPFRASIRRTLEVLLEGTVGDALETLVRWWQQRRIARDPATHEPGGRVVANDRTLEFHPRSAERAVLTRYNRTLVSLGLPGHEADSGLSPGRSA